MKRSIRQATVSLLWAVVTVSGCVTARTHPGGVFLQDDDVFVGYQDASGRRLISEEWREGRDAGAEGSVTYADEGEEAPEIVLNHARTNGSIWLRAILPDEDHEAKELRVLAENLVNNVSAFGYYRATIGTRYTTVETHSYVATALDHRELTISGQEAFVVVLDIADADQLELDYQARIARVMVVLIRMGEARTVREGRMRRDVPVILIAGYANSVDDFDPQLGDFEAFLDSLRIGQDRMPAQ